MGKESLRDCCLQRCPHFIGINCWPLCPIGPVHFWRRNELARWCQIPSPLSVSFIFFLSCFCSSSQCSYISLKSESPPPGNFWEAGWNKLILVHMLTQATTYLTCNYTVRLQMKVILGIYQQVIDPTIIFKLVLTRISQDEFFVHILAHNGSFAATFHEKKEWETMIVFVPVKFKMVSSPKYWRSACATNTKTIKYAIGCPSFSCVWRLPLWLLNILFPLISLH